MINQYDNLVEATTELKKRGFTKSYEMRNGKLYCFENESTYNADQLRIVEYHRFEGASNPASTSVIFALEAEDGSKGVIISTYGAYMDAGLATFLDEVKIRTKKKDKLIS